VVLQTDWFPQPEHGGFYYALANGYYEAAGLDVVIKAGGTGVVPPNQVTVGAADFAIGRVDDIAVRIDKGVPLLVVAAQMQHDPQGLILHASNPITEWEELDGQRLFVQPGTAMVRVLERNHGINFTVAGFDFGMARFLADPEAIQQCFITSEPYYARKHGVETKVMPLSDAGFDPYRIIYTRRDYAEQRPDVVRKFVEASIRGWTDYIADGADRASAHALIAADSEKMRDPGYVEFSVSTMQQYHLIDGEADKDEEPGLLRWGRLQQTLDQLYSLGLTSRALRADEVATIKYLPEPLQAKAGEMPLPNS